MTYQMIILKAKFSSIVELLDCLLTANQRVSLYDNLGCGDRGLDSSDQVL